MNRIIRATALLFLLNASSAYAIPVSYTFAGTVDGQQLTGHLTIDDAGVSDASGTRYSGINSPSGMVIRYDGRRAVFDQLSIRIADDRPFGILGDRLADGVSFLAFNDLLGHSFSASFLDAEADAINNELLLPDVRAFGGGFCAQAEEGCSLQLFGERARQFQFFDWAFTRSNQVMPVPEPGTLAAFGIGLLGLLLRPRRVHPR